VKYLFDTNILVSAALFPDGVAGQAYDAALVTPVTVVVCDYSLAELRSVFKRKFPGREAVLTRFIDGIEPGIRIVSTPLDQVAGMSDVSIRDPKDLPILNAALAAHVDVIVTGDKDLLEAGLGHPDVITPAEFLIRLVNDPASGGTFRAW